MKNHHSFTRHLTTKAHNFFAQNGNDVKLFDCERCSTFAIIGIDEFPEKGDRALWTKGTRSFRNEIVRNMRIQ